MTSRKDQAPVRVLVIDDSAFNRDSIAAMLDQSPQIEVVGRARDGNEGLREVVQREPDVITLDLEMPRMDGYTFLRILMTRRPTPVVVISSHSARESVFKALELGAVDFIAKPARTVAPELETIRQELLDKVLAVGRLRPVRLRGAQSRTATEVAAGRPETAPERAAELRGLVCIGASTGGPPALKEIVEQLPGDLPVAVLISQHMPASFTGPFARRLDSAGALRVREAGGGDLLEPGVALVAPGSGSLVVSGPAGATPSVDIESGEPGSRRRIVPSADRMMESAAAVMGRNTMGVVLTGMGRDGSRGVVAIREAGGVTVAEAESSAVIFGMPEAAISTGAVDDVVPIGGIADAIVRFARSLPR
jgi:two-component system chemotaxis response regulator CheB